MNRHRPAALALALGLVLALAATARGQLEEPPLPPPDPEAPAGFPWAAFVFSVAVIGGLFALVRRQQRQAAAEGRYDRGRLVTWYCRACDRDVSGPACPRCRAANPFLEPLPDDEPRPSRRTSQRDVADMRWRD